MATLGQSIASTSPVDTGSGTAGRRSPWIRGPVWDLTLLCFAWVPFYALFVFAMHLGDGGADLLRRPGLKVAVALALGLIFVHRHYVFLMVFGDPRALAARPRAFVGSALAIVGATAVAWAVRGTTPVVWRVVVATGIIWNIWHSVMQRYGIGRMYAGKAGAGLEGGAHAGREKRLIWSAVALLGEHWEMTVAAGGFDAGRVTRVRGPGP